MNWPQLRTILWLRSRLSRNQWRKSGGIGAVITALVAVGAVMLVIAAFGGGLLAGMMLMGRATPMVVMIVWLGLTAVFLLIWVIGLITQLQRSETIDLPRLMHLPVQLGQIFVVNYIASLASPSVLLYVSAAIGLGIGLVVSRGPLMVLMIPLALSMVFMVTAWTYLLRGWLATLMTNPRKRRTVVMLLTMGLIVIAQAPNIYFNVIHGGDRKPRRDETAEQKQERDARNLQQAAELRQMLNWQAAVPPLWVSAGAKPLAEGRPFPALLGFVGCVGVGALGLRRAYTSTLRFYQGDSGGRKSAIATASRRNDAAPDGSARGSSETAASGLPGQSSQAATSGLPRRSSQAAKAGTALVERNLPSVPGQAAAIGLATFQGMLRAPEIKMQWGTSFLVAIFVGGSLLFRKSSELPPSAGPFIATAVIVFSMFMMVGLVANQFGFDRDGFRAFVLSPVERWKILFGKNLAAFPAAAASAFVLVTAVGVFLRLSPLAYVASLLQLVVAVLCAALAGNLMSILVPYRIQPGSMKPTKMPPLAMILFIFCQLLLPAALTPTFIPPLAGYLMQRFGYAPAAVVNLAISALFAAAMVFIYRQTLGPLGRLLHRRETKILQTVSEAVE